MNLADYINLVHVEFGLSRRFDVSDVPQVAPPGGQLELYGSVVVQVGFVSDQNTRNITTGTVI